MIIKNIIISLFIICITIIFIPKIFSILSIYLKDTIHTIKNVTKYKIKYNNNNIINNLYKYKKNIK